MNVFRVVAASVGREEVSKETLHESTDVLVVTVKAWGEVGGGEDLDCHVGDIGQPGALRLELNVGS